LRDEGEDRDFLMIIIDARIIGWNLEAHRVLARFAASGAVAIFFAWQISLAENS
jgi:hypothetical protein